MKRINFVVLIAILVFPVLSACSATPTPAPTPVPTDTAVPTAVPSATPEPTNTPPPEPDTPTPEPTPEPPEITVKKSPNLVYLDDGDSAHKLDLYIPDGMEGLLPILFIIPGLSQNRAALATQARHFANMGYATAVVGYRDPMENVYPIPIQDLFCALGWMHDIAAEYNLDPRNVFVSGFLYGGTQAALIGTVDDPASYMVECPYTLPEENWVRGTLMICGTFDYTNEGVNAFFNDPSVSRSFGGSYEEAGELWEAGSPITWADSNDPPLLWVCGENTKQAPAGLGPVFDVSFKEIDQMILPTGIPATLSFVPEHTWLSSSSVLVFEEMAEFMAKNRD